MPASQAGRRRFESGRPLQKIRALRSDPWGPECFGSPNGHHRRRMQSRLARIDGWTEAPTPRLARGSSYRPSRSSHRLAAEPSRLVRFGIKRWYRRITISTDVWKCIFMDPTTAGPRHVGPVTLDRNPALSDSSPAWPGSGTATSHTTTFAPAVASVVTVHGDGDLQG